MAATFIVIMNPDLTAISFSRDHVQKYVDENLTSNLLPHYSQTIFTKFKTTLKQIVWENFGGETHEIFRTQKGDIVSEFKTSQLIQLSVIDRDLFKKYFRLNFSCGSKIEAFLDEELFVKLFTLMKLYISHWDVNVVWP